MLTSLDEIHHRLKARDAFEPEMLAVQVRKTDCWCVREKKTSPEQTASTALIQIKLKAQMA